MRGVIGKSFVLFMVLLPVVLMVFALSGDPESGKTAYMNRCRICHGADGKGNPAMAKVLSVEFPDMSAEYIQDKPDAEIKEIVLKGKNKMMPVRGLEGTELENIIAYVRTLAKKEDKASH